MSEKSKPLEERLYNEFYEKFEKDREINGVFSKKLSKLGDYVKYPCGALALGLASYVSYKMFNDDITARDSALFGGLSFVGAGLGVHMYDVNKIFEKMNKKNNGQILNEKEISDVKTAGKIGRYAHLGSATIFSGVIGTLMFSEPSFLIVAPILPFWYHLTINKGYGALYSAAVDYNLSLTVK